MIKLNELNYLYEDNITESYVYEDIEKHDILNPKLFNEDETLKEEVKDKILEIVDEFKKGLEEDGIKINIKDIRLVGSNCSYNYTKDSDLDVHIMVDTESLDCPDNLYPLLYSAYRSIWNNNIDIDFYGIPVELYVEEMNEKGEIKESLRLTESKQDEERFKQWLNDNVDILNKESNNNYSDSEKESIVNSYINLFKDSKQQLKSPKNDIYYWIKKGVSYPVCIEFVNLMNELANKRESNKKEKEGAKLLYNKDGWKVYEILNYEASVKYGKNTKWCISGSERWANGESGDKYWDEYTSKGVKFYFFINGNNKYALAVYPDNKTYEIFDETDTPLMYIPNAPKIEEIPVDYSDSSNSEFKKFTNMLVQNKLPDSLELVRNYFRQIADGMQDIETDVFNVVYNIRFGLIPEGYIEYLIENIDTEEYDDWGGGLPYIDIDTLVDEEQLKKMKDEDDFYNYIINDLKNYKYYVFTKDTYEYIELRKENDFMEVLYDIYTDYDMPEREWSQFIRDLSSVCLDELKSGIQNGTYNKDDYLKLGFSEEFLTGTINESLELDESAKTDFLAKFGEKMFNDFVKASQRLKNKGYSTDFGQYLKYESKELQDLLLSLYDDEKDAQKKRMIQGTNKEIRGKYNYLGEKNGYKVYQPLDVEASMDLGVNTGWCTTGRYRHYGHPEFTPSLKDAESHWNNYTEKGIKFYYFLNPETMYGEYALALYPKILNVNKVIENYYIKDVNFELFNAEDDLEYLAIKKLPLDIIDDEIKIDYVEDDDGLFIEGNILVKVKNDITEVKIPNSVTSIGRGAFYYCTSLTSITIPDSVTDIGMEAFCGCSSLTSITIPEGVTSIGDNAFSGCSSLTSITIPEGVTSIGDYAFYGCSSLISITIPEGVTSIGDYAFCRCSRLESIDIPDSVTSIDDCVFYKCTSLTSIKIPNSVTSIGKWVFDDCPNLKIDITDARPEIKKKLIRDYFLDCVDKKVD